MSYDRVVNCYSLVEAHTFTTVHCLKSDFDVSDGLEILSCYLHCVKTKDMAALIQMLLNFTHKFRTHG